MVLEHKNIFNSPEIEQLKLFDPCEKRENVYYKHFAHEIKESLSNKRIEKSSLNHNIGILCYIWRFFFQYRFKVRACILTLSDFYFYCKWICNYTLDIYMHFFPVNIFYTMYRNSADEKSKPITEWFQIGVAVIIDIFYPLFISSWKKNITN